MGACVCRGDSEPTWGARRDERGLMTLEWLLIVALTATLGAVTSVIVQRVVDDEIEVAEDPAVRFIDADIRAAEIADAANAAAVLAGYDDDVFAHRCETQLVSNFARVIASATWMPPVTSPGPDPDLPPALESSAVCTVVPVAGLRD